MLRPVAPRRLALALGGIVLAVGLYVLLEAASVHAFVPNSDGATVVLEGKALLGGNLLLRHWNISLDSFWLVDVLWYAVAVALVGLKAVLLHAVPAAIAAVAIVVGVAMALEERRGAAAVAAGGTVIAILAFPSQALAQFLLRGPLHVGTALWALVAFLGLRRGRYGWGWVVAVVFFAAGMLSDLLILAFGVVPAALAGVTAALRTRDWRRSLPLVSAAVVSGVLAEAGRVTLRAIGTFKIASANPISSPHQMLLDVRHGLHEAVLMLGVGSSYYGLGGEPTALSYVHLVAVLLVAVAVAGSVLAIVWGSLRGRLTVVGPSSEQAFRLDDMLLFATLASGAVFVMLATVPDPQYARYLTSGIVFGAILTARMVGRIASVVSSRLLGGALAAAGLVVAGCFAAGVAFDIAQPAPVTSASDLVGFLESHHLLHGVGAYWSASIVTVESGGKVQVRPVVVPFGHEIRQYDRNSSRTWYRHGTGDFLVYEPGAPWGGVDRQNAVDTFGPAARSYNVYGYEVLVWNKQLVVPANPGTR